MTYYLETAGINAIRAAIMQDDDLLLLTFAQREWVLGGFLRCLARLLELLKIAVSGERYPFQEFSKQIKDSSSESRRQ